MDSRANACKASNTLYKCSIDRYYDLKIHFKAACQFVLSRSVRETKARM